MEIKKSDRFILCIDLKSFYASCECVSKGWNPFDVLLAVVGRLNEPGSIVLAASPALKKLGAKSRCRAYELAAYPQAILVPCRMRYYLKISKQIVSIYLKYIAYEDLHVYSIDEAFLDVTHYLKMYQCSAYELAKRIMNDIVYQTGIPATCGIGPNLLLAKVALDTEAKQMADGIAQWTFEDVETKLWRIRPLSKMWGIGDRLEKRLNDLRIYEIDHIANTSITLLKREFGVLGEQLYAHSHGIDESEINESYSPKETTIGGGQVLMRDYYDYDLRTVLFEQIEEVMIRLHQRKLCCQTLHLSIGYSQEVKGGFSRQLKLEQPTDLTDIVFENCWRLFKTYYTGQPIRKVNIQLGQLCKRGQIQLNLFEDTHKKQQLAYAMDEIRLKHGKNSLLRAISYQEEGTACYRNTLMGGHRA